MDWHSWNSSSSKIRAVYSNGTADSTQWSGKQAYPINCYKTENMPTKRVINLSDRCWNVKAPPRARKWSYQFAIGTTQVYSKIARNYAHGHTDLEKFYYLCNFYPVHAPPTAFSALKLVLTSPARLRYYQARLDESSIKECCNWKQFSNNCRSSKNWFFYVLVSASLASVPGLV